MPLEDRGAASLVSHALVGDALATLRDAGTDRAEFRRTLVQLGRLLGAELVDAAFETDAIQVETPLGRARCERVAGRDAVVLVSVLRAATPLVEGLLSVFPSARQGVISASRNEAAGMDEAGRFPISIDYVRLPDVRPGDAVIVADPMLATGSTMCAVLDRVGAVGDPRDLVVLSAVSAPAGIDRVAEAHPGASIVTAAIDDRLDDDGFIVPGLGDAGDRAFGT